jgi:polysaccharide deacetylase 2 family uncharacterized protein YibQ
MLDKLTPYVELRPMAFGLGGIALLWVLLFFYFLIANNGALKHFESQMPVQTAVLEKPKVPEVVTPEEVYHEAESNNVAVQGTEDNGVLLTRDSGLFERTEFGALPVRHDGNSVFRAYKSDLKQDVSSQRPRLYLALKGYGLSAALSQKMLYDIPTGRMSLLLSPYALSLQSVRNQAAKAGFETWLSLPVQDKEYPASDYGPLMLRAEKSFDQNMKNFYKMLASVYGVVGVSAYTDDVLATDMGSQALQGVFKEASERGLGLFEQNPKASATLEFAALKANGAFIQSDLNMADIPALSLDIAAQIEGQLRGNAAITLVVNANPVTLSTLKAWLPKLEQQGIQVLPLSYGVTQ